MENKRYYWLKLKNDFFTEKRIKKLRKIAGGDTYTIIYLKMQLLSLQDEGNLYFDGLEETFEEELALDIDEDVEDVKLTCAYLKNSGLLEQVDNESYLLPETIKCIGSETKWAEYKRNAKDKEQKNKELKYCKMLSHEKILLPNGKIRYLDEKRYGGNGALALDRAQGKCEVCGAENEDVVIHHNNGFSNELEDLVVCCKKCHKQLEKVQNNSKVIPIEIEKEIEKDKELEIDKEKDIPAFNQDVYRWFATRNLNITPFDYEVINKILNGYSKDKIEEALDIALERQNYKPNYVMGILNKGINKPKKNEAPVPSWINQDIEADELEVELTDEEKQYFGID